MTFTATPEPDNVPPRVRLDFDAGAGASFTELTVKRNGKAIREQPFAGGQTALAYDYEAPFGVESAYTATGSYLPSVAAAWSESWTSLAAWSGSTGSWSVASNKASTSTLAAPITRSAGGTIGRVDVTTLSRMKIELLDASDAVVATVSTFSTTSLFTISLVADNAKARATSHWSFSVVFNDGSVIVTASNGSWSIEDTFSGTPEKVRLTALQTTAAFVGPITVTGSTATVDYSDSDTATLDVQQAWLIHPSQPSLSTPIDSGSSGANVTFVEASTGDPRTSQAVRTVHRPTGRRRAVIVTSGPRQADEWNLVVAAATVADKAAVRAVVDDQTPLLLRIPPAFEWDLPDDWYSVGDVTVALVGPTSDDGHLVTLPLTPVDEPIVRQGALRNYGDVLTEAATYGDLLDLYGTYLDLLAGDAA